MELDNIFSPPKSKRHHFNEPQFTVQRQRYRGPKDSSNFNLELDQFLFSVRKLYERSEAFNARLNEVMELLAEGGEYPTNSGTKHLPGMEELVYRIEKLIARAALLREVSDESGRFSSRFGPRF